MKTEIGGVRSADTSKTDIGGVHGVDTSETDTGGVHGVDTSEIEPWRAHLADLLFYLSALILTVVIALMAYMVVTYLFQK